MPKQGSGGLCSARCRRCRYCYIGLDIALCRSMPMCTYLLETGRRRPCPAGEGCTEFAPVPGAGERHRRVSETMWRGIKAGRRGRQGDARAQ